MGRRSTPSQSSANGPGAGRSGRSTGPRTPGNGAPGRPPGDDREPDPFPRLTPCPSHRVTLPRSIGVSVEVGTQVRTHRLDLPPAHSRAGAAARVSPERRSKSVSARRVVGAACIGAMTPGRTRELQRPLLGSYAPFLCTNLEFLASLLEAQSGQLLAIGPAARAYPRDPRGYTSAGWGTTDGARPQRG